MRQQRPRRRTAIVDENPDSRCETNCFALDPAVIRICGSIEKSQLFTEARYEVLNLSAPVVISRQ